MNSTIKTVVIDAGHGGQDPGCVGSKGKEKDIALKIALKLGSYIEKNIPEVKVIYTRKTDVFIPLYQRAEIANKNEADLFISIHVNSSTKPEPRGPSTHVLGEHRANENFDVAVRENSVILLEEDHETRYEGFNPESSESYIMFSLMQKTYYKQSIEFAGMVQDEMRERAKRHDRGVVQQGILVLAQTAMPGVLVETGFISNPEEEKYLMSDQGQEILASAVFRAFRDYRMLIEERSHFTTLEPEDGPQKETIVSEEEGKETAVTESSDLVFKVQIASSKNRVDPSDPAFKGYRDVTVFDDGRWYKYAVCTEKSYKEILTRCTEVKKNFPDAFIIAVKGGKIVPLKEALVEINE
ncbi:MAG: N-acetylmuramoyl-L-alanine amidase family protein [Bacteroidota bacterium]